MSTLRRTIEEAVFVHGSGCRLNIDLDNSKPFTDESAQHHMPVVPADEHTKHGLFDILERPLVG